MGPITIQDKIIDGIGQMETPQWRGSYTGGIWQDVFLSYTCETHINDVFITGNFRNGDIERHRAVSEVLAIYNNQ